jgi:hypothetical protein
MPPNFELQDHDPFLLMIMGVIGIAILVAMDEDFDETPIFTQESAMASVQAIVERTVTMYNLYKRGSVDADGLPIPKRRCSVTNFNWERARAAIFEDNVSPYPKFNDRFFEHHFRVTRTIVEELRVIAAAADPFFRETDTICPDAKILFPLQMLANGTLPSAHQNYYQMGETTARGALKKLCRLIYQSDDLREQFFRKMT